MIDEGYTKFKVCWDDQTPLRPWLVAELERWRQPLYAAGLVGHYKDLDIGYGNLSMRVDDGGMFIISGTQTGHLARTDERHYALVTAVNIDDNSVHCRGATQASSETLTHAAIYKLDPSINAVVHVHSPRLWNRLTGSAPTTNADVAYGTPAMAAEFARLYAETPFAECGLAIMAGHESGLVTTGGDLEEAALRILSLNEKYERVMER